MIAIAEAPMTVAEAITALDAVALTRALRADLISGSQRIPAELRERKGWLVWRIPGITLKDGKPKVGKMPVYPRTGRNRSGVQGSEADLDNLGTWQDVIKAVNEDPTIAGVGFACLPHLGVVALDVDRCVVDGVVRADAAALAESTYCEVSPSGTGIRALWIGEATNSKNNANGVELYHSSQFVTITGNVIDNSYRLVGSTALPTLDASTRAVLERAAGRSTTVPATAPERASTSPTAPDDPKLQAIHAAGLYERRIGPGKHSITCPFEDSHSDVGRAPGDADTIYLEPHYNGVTVGILHCSHTHGNNQDAYWEAIGYADGAVSFDVIAALESNLIAHNDGCDLFETLPHVVDKWLPCDEVTLLAGHGGGGKSYMALLLGVHVALGLPFAGLATVRSDVLFFSAEDGARVLRQRLAKICRALSIDPAILVGKLHLLDASDLDPALYRENRAKTDMATPLLSALTALVQQLDAGLIIVDNASDTFDANEIDRAQVRGFIRSLRSQLARPGRAVLLLAHINKASAAGGRNVSTEQYTGSTAWHNSVRSRLSLVPVGTDGMTIEHMKANLGAKAAPVSCRWVEGVPIVQAGGNAALTEAAIALQSERDETDKLALMELVCDFDRRGERLTTSFTGPATVFKVLKLLPGFPADCNSDRLTALLRSLETDGLLFRRVVKTPDRKLREVFTLQPAG